MIGLPNPYLAGGIAIALIAAGGGIYFKGRGDGAASAQAKYARASEKAVKAMRKGAAVIDQLNGRLAAASNLQQSETGSIRNAAAPLITRTIYITRCVDADGVGLLDRARANSNRTIDSGQLAGFTPGASGVPARP